MPSIKGDAIGKPKREIHVEPLVIPKRREKTAPSEAPPAEEPKRRERKREKVPA